MMVMKNSRFWLLVSLILMGLFVALKTLHIDFMVNYAEVPNYKSFCNINSTFNCDAVAASPFSHILGIPVALMGTLANLFLLLFLPLALRLKDLKNSIFYIYRLVYALMSLGCIVLASLSFFVLDSFCLMCIFFWLITWSSFALLMYETRDKKGLDCLLEVKQAFLKNWKLLGTGLILFIACLLTIKFTLFIKHCDGDLEKSCRNFDLSQNKSFLGLPMAPLEIVIYTDFQCPFCKNAHHYIEKLAAKYKEKLRFVRKEYPLDMACNPNITEPFHDVACIAAYYAKCAGKQGKFWEFHNKVYEESEKLSEASLLEIAKDLKLNKDELDKCVQSVEIKDTIAKDIQEATEYGIEGTPTFRIFGEIITGIVQEKDVQLYLDNYPYFPLEKLKVLYDQGSVAQIEFIDIRKKGEFEKEHLLSSDNIPAEIFIEEKINSDKPILIVGTGLGPQDKIETEKIFKDLLSKGFKNVLILKGGLAAWKQSFGDLNIVNQ